MKIDIYSHRIKQGLTQQELADKTGVSLTAINFYENGLKLPSLQVAYNMALSLNCKIDDFIID